MRILNNKILRFLDRNCIDKRANCKVLRSHGWCYKSRRLMLKVCASTCKLCSTNSKRTYTKTATTATTITKTTTQPSTRTTTTTTTTTPSTTASTTKKALTTRIIYRPKTMVSTVCRDRRRDCRILKGYGMCYKNKRAMQKLCMFTCKLCSTTITVLATTTTAPTTTTTAPTTKIKTVRVEGMCIQISILNTN